MAKKNKDVRLTFSESDRNVMFKNQINSILPPDIKIIAKNESQKKLIQSIRKNEITICSGHAGSGKTFVSLAIALSLLNNKNNHYRKIYLIKSVTTLKGEEIGYIKGDVQEKIAPFFMSVRINMEKIIDEYTIKSLFDTDIIRPMPLAFIRGVSLDNCILLIEEAQNISIDNMQTILTRIGKNAKMVIVGDDNQIDLKNKDESSLTVIKNILKDIPSIETIEMDIEDENVRNPIIKTIEKRFKGYYNK